MISSSGKIFVSETCHKDLSKNIIVCNKMEIGPFPYKLKDIECLEKILMSKRILFKKIAIIHEKKKFS